MKKILVCIYILFLSCQLLAQTYKTFIHIKLTPKYKGKICVGLSTEVPIKNKWKVIGEYVNYNGQTLALLKSTKVKDHTLKNELLILAYGPYFKVINDIQWKQISCGKIFQKTYVNKNSTLLLTSKINCL